MPRLSLRLAALAAVLGMSGPAAAYQPLESDPESISFGIISTESTQILREQWQPLLDDMSEALGVEVEPFFATDYAGVIEAMRFGKVHVAWFGNKSAMEAVDRAGAELFVPTTKTDGTRGYYSHILVPADSDIEDLDDLFARCGEGLDFGNGDPNSTSGFLVPGYYAFARNDVTPKECFDNVRNSNHGSNLMAVAQGQVDAATNNSEQVARTAARNQSIVDRIKVIWTSPMIPSDPITYREDLSAGMRSAIAAFFLGYGRFGPERQAELDVLQGISDGMGPFVTTNDTQLYPIRELELFKQREEIRNNGDLDPEEREEQLAEVDAELERLQVLSSAHVASREHAVGE